MALLGLIIALIVTTNNLTFQLIQSPKNIEMAQMIYGWARLYKPMMYDAANPRMVSFGYSRVRDIFDPVKVKALTGKSFFNFGVSGATSFESYRFIQNTLAVHKPEAVFLDLTAFFDAPRSFLVEHQFDPRILYTHRDGTLNERVKLNRWIKINTSGAALGFNYQFLKTLYAVRHGAAPESLLPSYQRRDWRKRAALIAEMKRRMVSPTNADGLRWPRFGRKSRTVLPTYHDLDAAVRLLCDADVDVHVYETPYFCGGDGSASIAALAALQKIAPACKSRITYHSFRYPNAVTMEAIIGDPRQSLFYRPDSHPRPPLGQMILTRIVNLSGTPGAPPLPSDFGVDLMQMDTSSANAWISTRAGRCYGNWEKGAFKQTVAEAVRLTPVWTSMYGPQSAAQ